MKCSATKALVPIQKNPISLPDLTGSFQTSLWHFRERCDAKIVFSVYTLDEQGYIYGEDCRLLETSIKPVFIDIYV